MSETCANIIAKQLKNKPNSVLGFATGSTPVGTYKKLAENKTDFSKAKTFNLDEYCGLTKTHPQSYHKFMMDNLFNHVNINKKNINLPNGTAKDFNKECKNYENLIKKSGGIDLRVLGVGGNGHIGFNEPDSVFHNLTHQITLTPETIDANKRFFEKVEDVPKTALSMGIKTIMQAKQIVLIAGADKKQVIERLKYEVVDPRFPVSILHYHPNCTVIFAKNI
ncbi:glucosamine-6-phosphate isomerase [Holotrichia oblita]|nr:glucosamine-6-phosphate isomerase [Holotrichia oblita]